MGNATVQHEMTFDVVVSFENRAQTSEREAEQMAGIRLGAAYWEWVVSMLSQKSTKSGKKEA